MQSLGFLSASAVAIGALLLGFTSSAGSADDDKATVAALDTKYQAAVEANDWAGMDSILADDFVLVTGKGKVFSKADLLNDARGKRVIYEHQKDSAQTVRVWGNTAVVTALLQEKGTASGKPFKKRLWFSDTYVKTPAGWRYVFGQASIPLK
jgi:ketosteroid isomerase-like protein